MTAQDLKNTILDHINNTVEKIFSQKSESSDLSFPPDIKLGDFVVECFPLAKQLRKSPAEIAKSVTDQIINNDNIIQNIQAVGPYINIKVANSVLFGSVCTEIITKDEKFGNSGIGHGQRLMVEYLSPNTNKPLHLGHLRNGSLGTSVANLFEATGYHVIKANLINDRGCPYLQKYVGLATVGKRFNA